MTYTLDTSEAVNLAIAPESDEDAILQAMYVLLNTTLAEVPCYREYGISKEYISKPITAAKSMLTVAISEAFEAFLPELTITSLEFSVDDDSPDKLYPRIEVEFNE